MNDMLSMKILEFVKDFRRFRIFSSASFAFVNYLLGTERKGYNKEFYEFIELINQGDDVEKAFVACFGEINKNEKKFWKYVRKM